MPEDIRNVATTAIPNSLGGDPIIVRTVSLATVRGDAPAVWEVTVQGHQLGDHLGYFATEAEALAAHETTVAEVKAALARVH